MLHHQLQTPIVILYGTSGSDKTRFFKHYLDQNKSNFLIFDRNQTAFPGEYFIPLLNSENVPTEQLENKTLILDGAGANKRLKTKVDDWFKFGRRKNIQMIYLAQCAKDVLPVVRENCKVVYHYE